MPRGVYNRKQKPESVETVETEINKSETIAEVIQSAKDEEKKEVQVKKTVLEPLGEGQQYFEAPDGTILIGEASATRLWYRAGNMWINPKREASPRH